MGSLFSSKPSSELLAKIKKWEAEDPKAVLAEIPPLPLATRKDNGKLKWPRQVPLQPCSQALEQFPTLFSGTWQTMSHCYYTFKYKDEWHAIHTEKAFAPDHVYDFLFMEDGSLRTLDYTEYKRKPGLWRKMYPELSKQKDSDGKPTYRYGPGHTSMLSDAEYEASLGVHSPVKYAGRLTADDRGKAGKVKKIDNDSGHFEPDAEHGYMVAIALGLDPLKHFKKAHARFMDYGRYYVESADENDESVDSQLQRGHTHVYHGITGYDGYNGDVYNGYEMRAVRAHEYAPDYTMANQNALLVFCGIILFGLICLVSCVCMAIFAVVGFWFRKTNEPRKRVNAVDDAMDDEMIQINNNVV